jgi:DNA-binding CsgD family transcriptional regulator
MRTISLVNELSTEFTEITDEATLRHALAMASRRMGFDHFALSFTPRGRGHRRAGVLVHDYPDEWASVYVNFDLAGADPVRRACDKALGGFAWPSMDQMIPMTRRDRQMLGVGQECGIGNGYTVPRHLPGDASGSCTFVVRPGTGLPETMLVVAEMIGAAAIAAASRITGLRSLQPVLSERQRECLLWSARGRSAAQIGVILGISEQTVIQHLKLARERYDVECRQSLIICALFDGLIGFADIFGCWKDD